MPFVEGEQTSFLTKAPLWSVIKHEFSLKRAWSASQDDYHREEGFAIGMNLHIGISGDIDWPVFVNAEIWWDAGRSRRHHRLAAAAAGGGDCVAGYS